MSPHPDRLLLALLVLLPTPSRASEWQPVLSRAGVSVSWRKLENARVREIRAQGVIEWPATRLLQVLEDVEHYPEFMPPTQLTRVLRRDGALSWHYVIIDPPFVSRRDYCVRTERRRLPDGSLECAWVQTEEMCPMVPRGVVRMADTRGRWLLRPLGAARTHAEYRGITDPAGSLPAWMVDRATARAMHEMFEALARAAADPRYGRTGQLETALVR